MLAVCALLSFLLIFGIGIGIILKVSRKATPTTKEVHNFWVMAAWGLFAYIGMSYFVLLELSEVL